MNVKSCGTCALIWDGETKNSGALRPSTHASPRLVAGRPALSISAPARVPCGANHWPKTLTIASGENARHDRA